MRSRHVVVVAYDGSELVDIACVTTGLFTATRLGADPGYEVTLATLGGREVRCDSGLRLKAQARLASRFETVDTLVVSGGLGHQHATADARLVGHVRRLAAQSRRVASVCTGASVLAAAGLLDGRRATTHWLYARHLAACFPQVHVDPAPVFVRDGHVATSGGVTAALDLTLAFIEEDHGHELARRVALGMVTYLQRPGNQAQMSMFTSAPRPDDLLVRRTIDHITSNPGADLRAATLAAWAGVSVRQLNRLFRDQLGEPPGRAVRRIRLEVAARLLAATELPLAQVAKRCAFTSAETMRQAFVERYGVNPSHFRTTQRRAATFDPYPEPGPSTALELLTE
ncbi:GlxA family transcriptional regulator [Micromonospora sp. NPDC048930]|uniref:GlxA family transcriptional regulator n=1 Tax=Micromonospora sp. NPDC048930 TaxID=3364261 RepID=UPI003713C634